MPNWCSNQVIIEGKREDIAALRAAFTKGEFLNFLNPEPEGLMESEQVEAATMPNWWHWRVANWGCKWEIAVGKEDEYDETQVTWNDTDVEITFHSAWAPPLAAFKNAIDKFNITCYYYEPGMCFAGKAHSVDTQWIEAEYILDDHTELPNDIDDMFMISEQAELDAALASNPNYDKSEFQ